MFATLGMDAINRVPHTGTVNPYINPYINPYT